MFKLRSIAARLILTISLTVAGACAILGTFSIIQQRALTRLALDQQLKVQYDSGLAARGRRRERRAAAGRGCDRQGRPRWADGTARRRHEGVDGAGYPADHFPNAAGGRLLPCSRAEGDRKS